MKPVIWYALACGFVGIMPCSFPFLMALEIAMIYHLSVTHRIPFRIGELSVISGILATCSLVLKILVELLLTPIIGVGWVVKGGVAFSFVMLIGWLVDSYYDTERSKLGR